MPKSLQTRHGAVATGLAQAKGGTMGPGGKFVGTTSPQDIARKTSMSQIGNAGPRGSNSGNSSVKLGKTGGMNRKFAGVVGAGKATGTK